MDDKDKQVVDKETEAGKKGSANEDGTAGDAAKNNSEELPSIH